MKRLKATSYLILAPAAALLLSGCVGTSTYGTGKTQEEQLYDDLLGIAAIGGVGKKKQRIDYVSRPKLVKPPNAEALPAPAENVSSQAGYFPQNPEARRAKLLSDIAEAEATGGELPAEVVEARRQAAIRSGSGSVESSARLNNASQSFDPQLAKRRRAEFLRLKAERSGATGSAPRKYLTEPPSPYRTPKQTAEVGVVGEKEKNPYQAGKDKNLLDRLLGK